MTASAGGGPASKPEDAPGGPASVIEHRPQKVFLPRLQSGPDTVGQFARLAEADVHGVHSITHDEGDADVVLFTESHMFPHDVALRVVRKHRLYRTRWADCFTYDERDRPWPVLPGLYVSQPTSTFNPAWQRAVGYHTVPDRRTTAAPDLLFSFAGSATHAVRERVFRLRHVRAHVERVTGFVFYDSSSQGFLSRKQAYDELLSRTKFVLCPRGKGTSSIRQYEVLAAGRVPVIIADDWVPPGGPDWSRFSVRCAEDAVGRLPGLLESLESSYEVMARAARQAYEEYFSPQVAFHRMVEGLVELRDAGSHRSSPRHTRRARALAQAQADHARWCGRNRLASIKKVVRP